MEYVRSASTLFAAVALGLTAGALLAEGAILVLRPLKELELMVEDILGI